MGQTEAQEERAMGDTLAQAVTGLRGAPLFSDASLPMLRRLAAAARPRLLARGDTLFKAGDASEGLYVLTRGQIKVYARSEQGQEKVIEVIAAPACVGESQLCEAVQHVSHAAALSEAHLLLLPRAALLHELEADPGLAVRLAADLSGRLNKLVRDIEAVTLHSAAQRVASYLRNLSSLAAESDGGLAGCMVSLPASKGTIASLLSVTPEHFSRILHDLQSRGLIAVNRRQIHIPDVARLSGLA